MCLCLVHRLIMCKSNSYCSGVDGDEEVVVAVVISRCHSAEMLEFVEEALDQVAVSIEERAERRSPDALGHGRDIGESALVGDGGAQLVGVIGAVGQQN